MAGAQRLADVLGTRAGRWALPFAPISSPWPHFALPSSCSELVPALWPGLPSVSGAAKHLVGKTRSVCP